VEKLKIIRCIINSGAIEPKRPEEVFKATINPESYTHNFALKYASEGMGNSAIGKAESIPKYATTDPEKLGFTIILDGTGVVPGASDTPVADQVDKLRSIVYDYDGDEHEPTPVRIIWGSGVQVFDGRLKDMAVDYTLFQADGTPLRAKIKMNFIQAGTAIMEALNAKSRSPDLTHVVRVKSGDTLPLLCHRIYKDASRYLAIAAFNDLDNFRELEPNTLLRFPPMR
jgi:nucleoid-associated protein YgaU